MGIFWHKLSNIVSRLKLRENGKKIAVVALLLYLGMRFAYVGVDNMQILVWCYFFRAVCLTVALLNMPIFAPTRSLHIYSFWLFAVHFWLDAYVSKLILHLGTPIYCYQLLTWVTVVVIGIAGGKFVRQLLPGVYTVLTGAR